MNRKQLVILVVLVIVLGALGWFLHERQQSANAVTGGSMGRKLLSDLPVNDVARITIRQDTNEVTLQKKNDAWRVKERKDYPANFSEISDFLLKAKDLKIVQTEEVGPSQLSRLSLVANDGTNSAEIVMFSDKSDKPIKSLWLGKKHMRKNDRPSQFGDMGEEGFPDGRYVKAGESGPVAVVSEAFANIEAKPEQWLNKDFIKIEKSKSVSVSFPAATNSWTLTRDSETNDWKLADAKAGENLDASKASSVENPLNSASFNDVDTQSAPAQLGLDKPTVLKIDTFDGLTYTVNVGTKTNDSYAMTLSVASSPAKSRTPGKSEKPEDKAKLDKEFADAQKKVADKAAQDKAFEGWVYLVSSWTLDPVLKERSQLLVEKGTNSVTTAAEASETNDVSAAATNAGIAASRTNPPPPAPAKSAPVEPNAVSSPQSATKP